MGSGMIVYDAVIVVGVGSDTDLGKVKRVSEE